MTNKERFEKENETITKIIKEGKFLNAKQGIEIGSWISKGLIKGLEEGEKVKFPSLDECLKDYKDGIFVPPKGMKIIKKH